jgi:hypothetical protein
MFRTAFFVVSLFLGTSLAGAADFSSLEERMSGDEFNAAGLQNLSPDELARLNDWLRANWPAAPSASTPYPANADTRGLLQPMTPRDAIVARIDGEFRGWNSRSVFRLDNGMVWEANGSVSPLAVPAITNPTVTIEPAFMGSWLMRVEGYNATIRVKRVE